jgi:hypothetical protein
LADADELALALEELDEADELDELLLHPAATTVHAMASRATTGALFWRNEEVIHRTLPLLVA